MNQMNGSIDRVSHHLKMPQGTGPHSIAVQLVVAGQERLLRGLGMVERDIQQGNVLRVSFLSAGDLSELLLPESLWKTNAISGAVHGCDLLIQLN
jgi:hypothetical protein